MTISVVQHTYTNMGNTVTRQWDSDSDSSSDSYSSDNDYSDENEFQTESNYYSQGGNDFTTNYLMVHGLGPVPIVPVGPVYPIVPNEHEMNGDETMNREITDDDQYTFYNSEPEINDQEMNQVDESDDQDFQEYVEENEINSDEDEVGREENVTVSSNGSVGVVNNQYSDKDKVTSESGSKESKGNFNNDNSHLIASNSFVDSNYLGYSSDQIKRIIKLYEIYQHNTKVSYYANTLIDFICQSVAEPEDKLAVKSKVVDRIMRDTHHGIVHNDPDVQCVNNLGLLMFVDDRGYRCNKLWNKLGVYLAEFEKSQKCGFIYHSSSFRLKRTERHNKTCIFKFQSWNDDDFVCTLIIRLIFRKDEAIPHNVEQTYAVKRPGYFKRMQERLFKPLGFVFVH